MTIRRVPTALVPFLLLVLATSAPSRVARAEVEPDYQNWVQILADAKLDSVFPGLRLSLDIHVRRMNAPLANVGGELVENPNTLLIVRPGIGYAFSSWGTVTLGYAATPIFFDDPAGRDVRNVNEHRVWTQLAGRWVVGVADLSFRSRMEHRVRSNGPGSPENDAGLTNWAHRFRQQVRAAITLKRGTPYQLVASNELFLHLNETNYRTEPGFDQNRAFVGLGVDQDRVRVEIGYMNQYVRRYTDANQANHALAVNAILKFATR